jgi:stress response protein SCP2
MNLQQGQSVTLSDLVGDVEQFEMKMSFSDWRINFNCVIGFDEDGLVSDDYLIYDTRTETPCHGVVLKSFIDKNPLFECQLNLIPAHINRLLFKVNIPASKQFSECSVEFYVEGQVISTLRFTNENTDIELGEFYREDEIWYFSSNVEKLSRALADIVHKKRFLIDLSRKDPEGFLQHREFERNENKLAGVNGFRLSPATVDQLLKVDKHYTKHSKAFIIRESMFSQKIPSKGNRLLVLQSYEPLITDTKNRYITLEMKNENKIIENGFPKSNDNHAVTYNEQRNSYQFSNLGFSFEIPRLSQAEIEDYYFEVNFSDEIVMEFNNLSRSKLFNRNKPVDILIRDNEIVALKQDSKLVKMSLSGIFDADIILRSYNFFDFYPQRIILNDDGESWLLLRHMFPGLNIYEHLEVIKKATFMNNKFRIFQIYKRVVTKKNRKLGIYLPNKNKVVSILLVKHSPYSSSPSFLFPEHFCQYEYDMEKAEKAKKEAQKEVRRLKLEQEEKHKELESANAFHEKMHYKDGIVISIKNLKVLYSIYNKFMNKSDVFMLHKSQFIHHRLPSKGGNLLVFNMDLSSLITDKDGNAISLYFNHCRDEMKHLNLFDDFALISEGKNKYYVEDNAMVFQVDKLSEDEQEDHSFEIELFDESYIYCDKGRDLFFNSIYGFNIANPVDILINNNKIVALQQESMLHNASQSEHFNNLNASVVLRSHNLYFFTNKFFYPVKEHLIIKNGDGEFWLLTQGEYALEKQRKSGKPTSYPFKIYEHLEVLRHF